jgi:hypothetical protein
MKLMWSGAWDFDSNFMINVERGGP